MAPAHGVVSASLEHMGFRVVAINIAYCSLGDPVINLLRMGEDESVPFLLVCKARSEQFIMPPKKQLKLIQ